MQTLFQDLRYGIRQLVKLPGFTLTAVLSLALGIGATTAVFSVVYGFLIDPYPYKDADRMVHLRLDTGKGEPNGMGSRQVSGSRFGPLQWSTTPSSPMNGTSRSPEPICRRTFRRTTSVQIPSNTSASRVPWPRVAALRRD
jgi:hypothetical protein